MYYVYEWFIISSGEIIYVGKGTGRRFKVRKHNKFFDEMIKRENCDSRIIKYFDNEQDAFLFEHDRIEELKKIGQCICNIHQGGFGGTTSWWTDERRTEYSIKNCMKSSAQRERMSLNNPMKNPEIAYRVNAQKRKPVIIGDIEYKSVKEVMDIFGVSSETVKTWCEKGVTNHYIPCRYKGEEQKIYSGRYAKGSCRAVLYNGKRYECATDLAKELNVSLSAVSIWARRGYTSKAESCRYADDDSHIFFEYKNSGWKNKKPVIVNNVRYESIREAEDKLGLNRGYLNPYFRNARKNTKYICKYDN